MSAREIIETEISELQKNVDFCVSNISVLAEITNKQNNSDIRAVMREVSAAMGVYQIQQIALRKILAQMGEVTE